LNTGGVPGFVVQSVYPDRYGYPLPSDHNPVSTDQTPLRERFGGWYITGTHGDQLHMGNFAAPVAAHDVGNVKHFLATLDLSKTGNLTDLKGRFNTDPYLTADSDLVSLMLLIHQTYVHNLMTHATYEARKGGNRATYIADLLVRAMFFSREANLTSPIKGTSKFASEFMALGPKDHKGRSLRDLDLNGRMFKYPLSYLIYSDGFEGLAQPLKNYVYKRIREVLSGKDQSPEFSHLSDSDRTAILEILQDTKPDFAITDLE